MTDATTCIDKSRSLDIKPEVSYRVPAAGVMAEVRTSFARGLDYKRKALSATRGSFDAAFKVDPIFAIKHHAEALARATATAQAWEAAWGVFEAAEGDNPMDGWVAVAAHARALIERSLAWASSHHYPSNPIRNHLGHQTCAAQATAARDIRDMAAWSTLKYDASVD